MTDVYSDDYRAARDLDGPPAISARLRRAAGAGLFLLLVIAMAVWAWRLGTRDAAEVPIIRAMEGPARVQPADPGGLQASHQGLEVNSVLGGIPAPLPARDEAPRVVPPPVALTDEDGPQGELVVAVPDFPTVAPEAGEDLRMPMQEEGPELLAGPATDEATPDASDEVAALVAAALGERTAEAEEPGEVAAAEPRPRGRPSGHVVRASAPASAPAPVRTAAATTTATATGTTTGTGAAPAAATPARPTEVTRLNPGTRLVQLGAFDSEAMARQTWSQLVGRHGDLLGAKSLYLERATHNARVFYRLRVAGFQNTDQTRMLCESLRARGVDCIPVTLN